MKKKRPNLADARMAALRLILLPGKYEELTAEHREFLRSDLVGELLEGEWKGVFAWIGRGLKWTTTKAQ